MHFAEIWIPKNPLKQGNNYILNSVFAFNASTAKSVRKLHCLNDHMHDRRSTSAWKFPTILKYSSLFKLFDVKFSIAHLITNLKCFRRGWIGWISLTLSWRRCLSYRNQSIDLHDESMNWFLSDNDFRHERVKLQRKWTQKWFEFKSCIGNIFWNNNNARQSLYHKWIKNLHKSQNYD